MEEDNLRNPLQLVLFMECLTSVLIHALGTCMYVIHVALCIYIAHVHVHA